VPASQVAVDLRGWRLEPSAPGTLRQRPNPLLEPLHCLWRDPALGGVVSRQAKTQPLTLPRSGDGAFRFVHDPREPFGDEPHDALHHPLTHSQVPHIEIAIVGVPDQAVPTSFKCLIPFVQHQVR
jgi:hypothetical protein